MCVCFFWALVQSCRFATVFICFFFVLLSFAGVAVPEQEAIDPYELIEAVEILSRLPKDFYENLVCIHDSDYY